MNDNKMIYNFSNVCEAVNLVKNFNFSVATKAEHFQHCYNIEKLLDKLYSLTGCSAFIASWSPWDKYASAINNCFMLKAKYSKKELDNACKVVADYIKAEVFDLYNGIIRGEYASDFIINY